MPIMPLTPINTVVEQYISNSLYEIHGSVAEAHLFLAAAMELSIRRPKRVVIDGDTSEWDHTATTRELARVRAWLQANGGINQSASADDRTRYYDHTNIRGD